jgi:O-6-methylguanine DNA methyltransferase
MTVEKCFFQSEYLQRTIEVIHDGNIVYSVKFIDKVSHLENTDDCPVMDELERYFSREQMDLSQFDLKPTGTNFQKKVWEITRKIPYGKTRTYKDIAHTLGIKGYRAVGRALGRNPIPILIPCHRVKGVNSIGGYSSGIDIKKKLLALEGVL